MVKAIIRRRRTPADRPCSSSRSRTRNWNVRPRRPGARRTSVDLPIVAASRWASAPDAQSANFGSRPSVRGGSALSTAHPAAPTPGKSNRLRSALRQRADGCASKATSRAACPCASRCRARSADGERLAHQLLQQSWSSSRVANRRGTRPATALRSVPGAKCRSPSADGRPDSVSEAARTRRNRRRRPSLAALAAARRGSARTSIALADSSLEVRSAAG